MTAANGSHADTPYTGWESSGVWGCCEEKGGGNALKMLVFKADLPAAGKARVQAQQKPRSCQRGTLAVMPTRLKIMNTQFALGTSLKVTYSPPAIPARP